MVLYLADGSCLVPPDSQSQLQQGQGSDESSSEAHNGSQGAWGLDSLENEVRESRRQYRRAILHQLLLFDSVITAESSSAASDVLLVPPPEKSRSTTIKTVMCDITAHLLRSMDDLAYEIESFPIIEPPWSASYTKYLGTDVAARVHARMSTPGPAAQSSFEQAGPNGLSTGSSISRSATPVGGRSASRHSVASPNRSDRLSEVSTTFGSRDVSRDRNSLVSPPIASPTERKKHRSIARSRIVIGALYLQAGLWPDAIKDLSEGTAAARSNNDYVWHAKGLEYIISCLFMFGWAKMYFQVSTTATR